MISDWRSGRRARVEEFGTELIEFGATEDDWHGLILTEIRARRDLGESPTETEYSIRFPDHADRLHDYFDEGMTCRVQHSGPAASRQQRSSPPTAKVPGYEILEVLGRGGMGVVYKARQLKLNRVVALKMILAGRHATEEDLQRFWLEAEAVAALSHLNIVQVHEVGEHDGYPYFSLEYVEGGTLAEHLRRGPLPFVESAKIAEGIARGAQAAHEQGIIHRDLKPANILLHHGERVVPSHGSKRTHSSQSTQQSALTPKVTDFGIAKRLNDSRVLTATGIAAGTPQYMAPEQALASKERPVGPTADVYSIGAVLYEMLCGRPPFDGDNPVEVMNRLISEQPSAPSRFNPSIPRDLETVCLKCLEKEPHRRYSSALALAEDLDRWLAGKPIAARPVSSLGQARRWCHRNPAVAGLLAGIMFVLLVGAATAGTLAVRANKYAEEAARNAKEAHANADEANRQAFESHHHATEAKANEQQAQLARAEEQAHRIEEARLRVRATEGERRRSRELYDAHMNLGLAAWESGHVSSMRTLLEKHRPAGPNDPDPRGFEWYYLSRLLRPYEGMMSIQGRVAGVSAVPRSTRWAICSSRYVIFWDASTSRYSHWPSPLEAELTSVTFNRDGGLMAIACRGPFVHVQDMANNRPLQTIRLAGDHQAAGLSFTPDGKTLFVALRVEQLRKIDGVVVAYDVNSGKELRKTEGAAGSAMGFAASRDGKRVAVASPNGEFRIWDAFTGQLQKQIGVHSGLNSLAFSPDGTLITGGTTAGTVGVWDVASGTLLRAMKGHADDVNHVAFSADGRHIASGAGEGTICVWDALTGEQKQALRSHERNIVGLAFAEQGTRLISTDIDNKAICWDISQDPTAVSRTLGGGNATSCLLHPDGARALIVEMSGNYRFVDLHSGMLSTEFRPNGPVGGTFDAALSPDGKILALATYQAGVFLVSLENPQAEAKSVPGTDQTSTVAFSPDGDWLATGHYNGAIFVHGLKDQKSPRRVGGVRKFVRTVAFDPTDSGRIAACSHDGTLRGWNHETGSEFLTLDVRDHNPTHLAFSPDGQRIATAGTSDKLARLWDANTGRMIRKFEGHSRELTCVAFSPDGTRLLTGSHDLTAKVWDVETGLPTISLSGHSRAVKRAIFDRDGTAVVSVNDFSVKIWDGHRAYLYEQGRSLASRLSLRQPKVEWDAEGRAKGSFRLVNETGQMLPVPKVGRPSDRIRVSLFVERLGSDALIPNMREGRPDEQDQYRLTTTTLMPKADLAPGTTVEGTFTFATPGWPPGKYRVFLEQAWATEPAVRSRAICTLVIP